MRKALSNLSTSFKRVRDITVDIDAHAADALKDIAVLERHNTVQSAATVVISGLFESFLKDLAEAFINGVAAKNLPFACLPPDIREAHYIHGGVALANRARRMGKVSWMSCSPEDIARRLASVQSGVPYEIVWEAFADTQSNPGPSTLKMFLERFGIRDVWTGLATKSGLSRTTLESQLESIIALRNECAHAGTTARPPSPSEIRDYCDFMDRLAIAVVALLEDHMAAI